MATIEELYKDLSRKYTILQADNEKTHNTLRLIASHVPHMVFDKNSEEILYFRKVGKVFYLNNNKEKNCLVCGEDKPTTAHHLIPRRAKCKSKILRELRIRVCEDCEKLVHPENKIFKLKTIAKQDELIKLLRKELEELKKK